MFGITREKNDKFRSCCKYILVVKWRLRQDCEIFLMRNRDLLLVIYLLFLTFANNWPRIPDLSSHAALCSALREGIAAIYSPTEKQGSCRTSKNIQPKTQFCFRFLDGSPDGNIYIVMCFFVRFVEALGASALATSSFAILANTFPDNVATVFVSW